MKKAVSFLLTLALLGAAVRLGGRSRGDPLRLLLRRDCPALW